ncbi:hypothetical protein GGR52DRAFT_142233 [Hypoxylon sp. FL1284]|nr:hypothetical protein GGR52DRAFT_142233 [Hypoxylon sp. FL1284]
MHIFLVTGFLCIFPGPGLSWAWVLGLVGFPSAQPVVASSRLSCRGAARHASLISVTQGKDAVLISHAADDQSFGERRFPDPPDFVESPEDERSTLTDCRAFVAMLHSIGQRDRRLAGWLSIPCRRHTLG